MVTDKIFKPVVIYHNDRITNYYGSHIATIKDGYDPNAVLNVCQGKQQTHKGKRFCFLEDFGILGEKIHGDVKQKKGGEEKNDNYI